MLAEFRRLALFLNEYANLLIFLSNLLLVIFTVAYVWLTQRTLEALRQASLREREALHLREIKDNVIQPIISWIRRVSEAFRGGTPELLTIDAYPRKPFEVAYTVDDPFVAGRRLPISAEPNAPDILATWVSLQDGRLGRVLYEHTKREHFTERLHAFDRLMHDVQKLLVNLISFAQQCAKDLPGSEIPRALTYEDENSMPEWTVPPLLVIECIQALLANRTELNINLEPLTNSSQLRTGRSQAVARAKEADRLEAWRDGGFQHVRKRWDNSDLPERVRHLLRHASTVQQNIELLLFTHSLGVDCELVSGEKRRPWYKAWRETPRKKSR